MRPPKAFDHRRVLDSGGSIQAPLSKREGIATDGGAPIAALA
jgi:hypothetical protein